MALKRCHCGKEFAVKNVLVPTQTACPRCHAALKVTPDTDSGKTGADSELSVSPGRYDTKPHFNGEAVRYARLLVMTGGSEPHEQLYLAVTLVCQANESLPLLGEMVFTDVGMLLIGYGRLSASQNLFSSEAARTLAAIGGVGSDAWRQHLSMKYLRELAPPSRA